MMNMCMKTENGLFPKELQISTGELLNKWNNWFITIIKKEKNRKYEN